MDHLVCGESYGNRLPLRQFAGTDAGDRTDKQQECGADAPVRPGRNWYIAKGDSRARTQPSSKKGDACGSRGRPRCSPLVAVSCRLLGRKTGEGRPPRRDPWGNSWKKSPEGAQNEIS